MAATFVIVTVAWVFFRGPTLGQAVDYLGAMVGLSTQTAHGPMIAGLICLPYQGLPGNGTTHERYYEISVVATEIS